MKYYLSFRHNISSVALALIIAGCATVPDAPARPAGPSAAQFDLTEAGLSTDPVVVSWWDTFDDPILTALIEDALASNARLDVARANIDTAKAILSAQQLDLSPATQTTTSASLGRATRNDADIEISGSAGLGASWEYDAFGRIEALIESSELNVETAEEARRDLAVIIAAETAQAYADLKGAKVRLDVAERNADLQAESLELLNVLFDNGRTNELDLSRAQAQYRTTLATLPSLEAAQMTAASRLAALTGAPARNASPLIERALASPAVIPEARALPSIGSPETLIRRRPDIRLAEANIARRLALGDVERARLFPTLSFNADVLGLLTDGLSIADGIGFNIGPALRWDGPDLRRVRADIEIADAQSREAYAIYTDTVITALQEVDVALIALVRERARRSDLEAAALAAQRATEIARLRFEEGIDDSLDVIDAQRTLLDAQDRLEQSKLATTNRTIDAYRALGGMWDTERLDSLTVQQGPDE